MNDIENIADIKKLVDLFYQKIENDKNIGFFFTKVAKVDWSKHLPKMYQFWETLLLGNVSYKGNPMAVHFPVNRISAMEKSHFEHWLKIWSETVKENFSGEKADLALYKANNIANLMAYKMEVARKLEN